MISSSFCKHVDKNSWKIPTLAESETYPRNWGVDGAGQGSSRESLTLTPVPLGHLPFLLSYLEWGE